jgi:L-amino acid N-acyltransferase YncA
MASSTVLAHHFPWTSRIADKPVTFRLMTPDDRDEVLAFVRRLPANDLFYLMDDIRNPSEMNRWIEGLTDHTITTVLAEHRNKMLGYGSLRCGHLPWTRHIGEVRIAVAPEHRSLGVGKLLAKEVFAVANDLGLRRIIARLTSKQTPARYLFLHLGFHIEALLADCVIDNEGHTEDLLFMSYDVTGFHG